MTINTDGPLPDCYAKIDQVGLKIALGMENYPSNRMLMCYGPPGGGKSTLLYSLIGQYLRNEDEVWLVDAERAIDRIYLASYLTPGSGGDTSATILEALKYEMKTTEARLKKEHKAPEQARGASEEQIEMLERRMELLPKLIKEIKDEVKAKAASTTPAAEPAGQEAAEGTEAPAQTAAPAPAPEKMDPRTRRSLIRRSVADYRLRNVKILQFETLEEFEKETVKMVEARKEDPARRHKRLLIGVDSINCLLPAEVLERATSSEGSNFVTAKYMHTLLPKLITKLSGTETSIFCIHQKTTTIKINYWEQKSPIDDVATKGGSAAKFGATIMVGVEKRKKMKGADDKEYDSGIIEIPKAKLRSGSRGTYKGAFLLRESVECSIMDFNTPFILKAVDEEQFGLKKARGSKVFIPARLLEGHPDMEDKIRPALGPLPKKEKEGDEDKAKDGKDEPAEPDSKELYYQAREADVVDLLASSPAFEEECLLAFDIMKNV